MCHISEVENDKTYFALHNQPNCEGHIRAAVSGQRVNGSHVNVCVDVDGDIYREMVGDEMLEIGGGDGREGEDDQGRVGQEDQDRRWQDRGG